MNRTEPLMAWEGDNYFSDPELRCHCGCGKLDIQPDLRARMNFVREQMGMGVTISRAYSCPTHNAAIGGAKNSAHLHGFAVDLPFRSPLYAHKLISVLMASSFDGEMPELPGLDSLPSSDRIMLFRRLMVYERHVHADFAPEGNIYGTGRILLWAKYA